MITILSWDFFQIAISLLVYVATFAGLNFWRSNFFTLFQSNYFEAKITFSEQLFLQNSCFLKELLFQNSHFFAAVIFQNSFFFRVKPPQDSLFLKIGSYLEQLFFGAVIFLAEELFGIKISTEVVLFRSRYFCADQLFLESCILEKANISEMQYSVLASFSGELLLQSDYFFKRCYFLKRLLFQKIVLRHYSVETYFYCS